MSSRPEALPLPSADALAHSENVRARLVAAIQDAGGWIGFDRYMDIALYEPGLGYYSAGSRKLGADGDFITAPELSPLFGQTFASSLAEVMRASDPCVLEVGAGSGALAADVLLEMQTLNCLPEAYCILELSADLRERQRECITRLAPALVGRMQWLDALPAQFEGVVLANEVLDATPAHVVTTRGGKLLESFVKRDAAENTFHWFETSASDVVRHAAEALQLPANGYQSEINLTARALATSFARLLTRGVLLFIDYGFPAHEFYNPQRTRGTLMCHYRHHAHDDPFAFVGLQDITTHVDFSAVAAAAREGGATLAGYASQANFLINCGITELLAQTPASDARAYAPLVAQAQKLLSPAEMGELFKVIALAKNVDAPLLGFARGDKSHTL